MAADAGLGIVFAAVLAVTVYRLAAAGIGVTATGWLTARPGYGTSAPVEFGILGWVAAVAAGLALRFADQRRRATDESIRRQERLTLARELHDVVAHHVTGIVLQAQAARIVSQDSPHELDQMLTEIEAAGTEAMTAMSRVVTLLRDPDDAAPASRKRRRRTPVTIKVLLADDQAIVRRGLRLILDAQPGITVIAEAADGAETVALARQLRPDVCLVDIRMPRLDGIEVTRTLAGPTLLTEAVRAAHAGDP